MTAFTADQKAACAERELKQRTWVYQRRIEAGKMTKEQAGRELAMMAEIAADYRRQAETQGRLL